jgi:hypothetical protein
MVEALLIPHCMIDPKGRIFRVRTLQAPASVGADRFPIGFRYMFRSSILMIW